MSLTIQTYWPLALLVLVPALWSIRRFTAAGLSPRHLRLSTLVRTVVVLLLILAMTQPVLHLPRSAVSIAYVIDVSKSISPSALQESIEWIRRTNAAGKPSHSRFIAFAANSKSFDRIEDLTQVAVSQQANANAINQSKTNISAALERALQSFEPHNLKRLVLLSDGNENQGEVATLLPRLRQQGVEVFTIPMTSRSTQDVWVERLAAPARVNADEQFPLELQVVSPSRTTAKVEIRNNSKTLLQKSVSLQKGLNRIALETSIGESAGPAVLEAAVQVPGDPFPENNLFRQSILVLGRPLILYVEGHSSSAHYLKDALTTEGLKVDVSEPMGLPDTAEALAHYDAIVLSDVDVKGMSERQMEALSTYVRDLGGGFILAGGENVYGEGGYSKTPIEEILPVTFDVQKPRQSVSMIVILDKSGSMAGDKIRYAKEAAKAPLSLLKDTDHFGMLTFNFNASWVLKPQLIVDRTSILSAIDEIGVGGETNLYPAMKEAFAALQKETDEIKHIIILSDGRTLTDDFAGLTKQMADERITVSTVSVGQEADRELMSKIATWGKGKTYYAEDPAGVPQIFNQDVESSAGEALQEASFQPAVIRQVEAFKGISFQSAPRLLGYVQVKAKPMAEVLLEARKDRPLLARWQYGLGKAAVFTSDVKDRWAVDWLKWNGYSKFWSQTVRETMRRQDETDMDFHVERDNEFAVISMDVSGAGDHRRDRLQMQVHVVAPDQSTFVVDVPQIAPGSYETRIPLQQEGTYIFRASSNGTQGSTRTLAYSYPSEYRWFPPDLEKLRTISSETGGTFQPNGPEIFATGGESSLAPFALWPLLGAAALILYLLDVLLRRFRLFEESWNNPND